MRKTLLKILINDLVSGKTLREVQDLKYRYMEIYFDGQYGESDYYIIMEVFDEIIERWEKNW